MSESNSKHRCNMNMSCSELLNAAIDECYENEFGELWVRNTKHQFGTQVNFCPFCGHKAKSQFVLNRVKSNSFVSSLDYKCQYNNSKYKIINFENNNNPKYKNIEN